MARRVSLNWGAKDYTQVDAVVTTGTQWTGQISTAAKHNGTYGFQIDKATGVLATQSCVAQIFLDGQVSTPIWVPASPVRATQPLEAYFDGVTTQHGPGTVVILHQCFLAATTGTPTTVVLREFDGGAAAGWSVRQQGNSATLTYNLLIGSTSLGAIVTAGSIVAGTWYRIEMTTTTDATTSNSNDGTITTCMVSIYNDSTGALIGSKFSSQVTALNCTSYFEVGCRQVTVQTDAQTHYFGETVVNDGQPGASINSPGKVHIGAAFLPNLAGTYSEWIPVGDVGAGNHYKNVDDPVIKATPYTTYNKYVHAVSPAPPIRDSYALADQSLAAPQVVRAVAARFIWNCNNAAGHFDVGFYDGTTFEGSGNLGLFADANWHVTMVAFDAMPNGTPWTNAGYNSVEAYIRCTQDVLSNFDLTHVLVEIEDHTPAIGKSIAGRQAVNRSGTY